jgi:hypothetical protein
MAALLFWDTVGKAANLFQLLGGLDAITLITVATSFLRFHEIGKECSKLQERVRALRQLLLSPAGRWAMRHNLELARMVVDALKDAHDLVQSCNRSSILARVRRGGTMVRRFRDLRSSIGSCCGLILSVNAVLLVGQASRRTWPPPPSPVR